METRLAPSWVSAAAGVAAVVGVAFLLALAPAPETARAAVRPAPSYLNAEFGGPHFVVHYTPNQGTAADRLSEAGAAALLANAEAGYAWEVLQQGFPAPLDDGDGRTDIYVYDLPPFLGGAAAGRDDESLERTSGFVVLDPTTTNVYAISHEFFHLIQFGILAHTGFFSESTAEWAGQAVVAANGGSPPPNWFPIPQVPLDCLGSSCSGDSGGYHGSIFWEYLSERLGTGIVHEAYERDAALAAVDHQPHDLQALGEVLAAHGSSLAAAFEGYAVAAVAGQITRPGVLPHSPAADRSFGAELPIHYPPLTLSVDHLAMKLIAFYGSGDSAARCRPATLRLEVSVPAGVPTNPFFVTYPATGSPPATAVHPLAIAGSTASAEVPWATCAASVGALALPNASTGSDGQPFTVNVSVAERRLKAPRLSGKPVQRVGKLAIRVHSTEAVSVRATARVILPRKRGALSSRTAKARIGARRSATVHLKFAAAKLKAIEAALASGRRIGAKVTVTARNAAGLSATASRKIRLKP